MYFVHGSQTFVVGIKFLLGFFVFCVNTKIDIDGIAKMCPNVLSGCQLILLVHDFLFLRRRILGPGCHILLQSLLGFIHRDLDGVKLKAFGSQLIVFGLFFFDCFLALVVEDDEQCCQFTGH